MADTGEQLVTAISNFNELIESSLEDFTTANTGITAKLVDTHLPFNTAIDDPEEYGAPDATCYNEDGVSCVSGFLRLLRPTATCSLTHHSYGSTTTIRPSPSRDSLALRWRRYGGTVSSDVSTAPCAKAEHAVCFMRKYHIAQLPQGVGPAVKVVRLPGPDAYFWNGQRE
jgi:hypothetical protein